MDFLKKIGNEVMGKESHSNASSGSNETWYITAIRGEGLEDKDKIGKSDPYLKIEFGGKSVRTKTIKNNLSPQWNETFTFELPKGKETEIKLKVMDDDIGFDDTIGCATVSKAEFPFQYGEERRIQIPITKKNGEEYLGIIHLAVKKMGNNMPSYGQSNYNQQSYSQQPYQQPSYQQPSYQQPSYQQPSSNQQNYGQDYNQQAYRGPH